MDINSGDLSFKATHYGGSVNDIAHGAKADNQNLHGGQVVCFRIFWMMEVDE